MTERDNRDTSADVPATDRDTNSNTDVSLGENSSGGPLVRSLVIDDETVLYDLEDHQRWLQSDTAVVLTEAV